MRSDAGGRGFKVWAGYIISSHKISLQLIPENVLKVPRFSAFNT